MECFKNKEENCWIEKWLLGIHYKSFFFFIWNKILFSLEKNSSMQWSSFLFWNISIRHGLQTPNEAFFHWNPKLLGVGRQNGQINSWTFGVFWPDCQHSLFLRLYIHILTKCLFGIGFWIWAAKKFRFSLRVSVVRGFKGLLLFYHSLISIGVCDRIKIFS